MNISDELREKIEKTIPNNEDLKNKLIEGNVDAIRSIGIISQRGVDPKDIITAYESNNLDSIYKKAKKLMSLQEIYKDICIEIAQENEK